MSTDQSHLQSAPGMREALPPLPDITEVEPLSEKDRDCLQELRSVLERHGALSRFGVTLLHGHFEIADDEVLMESVDVETRTLTSRPVKVADHSDESSVETSWRLDSQTGLQRCESMCVRINGPDGKFIHDRRHFTTG